MDLFDVLSLIGGLCLFLFGMDVMGQALERCAGSKLRNILGALTNKKSLGFLTGLLVTAVIQSSSATTVMVVGFVNSGLLTLQQAISVIMGANVGTTVTAWLLSMSGISGDNLFIQLLKPTSFTPILALVGIILMMFFKSSKNKDIGSVLLGFATLMFGMDAMSKAVSGLGELESFRQMFLMFQNPILGVLAGAILTAIIQSSSASVGILQALSATGQVSYGSAIPIIMGQNIGTCITAIFSSIGTTKNAKRAALVHLSFNIIGTTICLTLFYIAKSLFAPILLVESATAFGIAVSHSVFNVVSTLMILPMTGFLEFIVNKIVPDAKVPEINTELDDRLLTTPPIALERCSSVTKEMAECAVSTMQKALSCFHTYSPELAEEIRENEEKSDHYEDILGSYLVRLSALQISNRNSAEAGMLLKLIGDFERISDHGVQILESVEEMRAEQMTFSDAAMQEIKIYISAIEEILQLALASFVKNDSDALSSVEPLNKVVGHLKETIRTNHIRRLQQGNCTIHAGFVWSDILTNLQRTADHCSNVAGCIIDYLNNDMNMHEHLREIRENDAGFKEKYGVYKEKYAVVK